MTVTTDSAAAAAARAAALARIAEAARQRAEAARERAEAAARAQKAAAAKVTRQKPAEKVAKPALAKVSDSDFEVTATRGKRLASKKATHNEGRSDLTQEEVVAYTAAVKVLQSTRGYSESQAHRAVGDDPRVAGLIVDASHELADGADIDEISATMTAALRKDKTLGLPEDLINPETGQPLTEADGAGGSGRADGAGKAGRTGPVNVAEMSQSEKFDYYADVIRQAGGKLRTSPNDRNVLSFRNENSTRINGGQGAYNDVTVMMWKDSSGRKHVREYWSNTEPVSYYEGRMGVDANRDGRLDQGRIPTGHYEYRKGYSSNLGNVLRPTRDFAVERDVNHDGVFNKKDGNVRTSGGGSMLFHSGGSTFVGSAGCQTMPPEVYARFWNDLGSGTVGYTLVEGKPGQSPLVSKTNETAEARFANNGLSLTQLKKIMPDLPPEKAEAYLPFLNKAMEEAKIDTPKRAAAFLAQLAHESAQLKYFEEIASGAAYEGRSDLGNTQPGDGVRFKGRGPIQLTGRANYAAASKALGINLVANPERAADPDVGFRVAAWYWKTRGLNELADKGDFTEITRRINGGYNGLEERKTYYRRALDVLSGGLAGGPISTGNISTPGSSSSYYGPTGYSSPGGRSPSSGYSDGVSTSPSWDSPRASGPERNVAPDDFGGTSDFNDIATQAARSTGVDFDLMAFILEFLMELLSDYSLWEDPEFKEWAKKQPGMKGLKPGQPIPKKMKAKFLADKLEKAMKGKKGDGNALRDAAAKLVEQFAKKERVVEPPPEEVLALARELEAALAAQPADQLPTAEP